MLIGCRILHIVCMHIVCKAQRTDSWRNYTQSVDSVRNNHDKILPQTRPRAKRKEDVGVALLFGTHGVRILHIIWCNNAIGTAGNSEIICASVIGRWLEGSVQPCLSCACELANRSQVRPSVEPWRRYILGSYLGSPWLGTQDVNMCLFTWCHITICNTSV